MDPKTTTKDTNDDNDWKSGGPPAAGYGGYPPLMSASLPPYYAAPPDILKPASLTHQPDPGTTPWSTGLFDCFDDINNCILTSLCPCVTFGQNAEIIDRGMTPCGLAGTIFVLLYHGLSCSCWFTCMYRTRLRGFYGIPGDQWNDFCVHMWCCYCAFCQEYRELKNRGYDPLLGWYENERRKGHLPTYPIYNAPPAVPDGMYRCDEKAST